MKFSLFFLSVLVAAAPKCPKSSGKIIYKGKCLDCDKHSGFVCDTQGGAFKNECALAYATQELSIEYVYRNGTCVKPCAGVISNPICATGGVIYDNFCLMDAAGATQAENLVYDSITKTCIDAEGQNPGN